MSDYMSKLFQTFIYKLGEANLSKKAAQEKKTNPAEFNNALIRQTAKAMADIDSQIKFNEQVTGAEWAKYLSDKNIRTYVLKQKFFGEKQLNHLIRTLNGSYKDKVIYDTKMLSRGVYALD